MRNLFVKRKKTAASQDSAAVRENAVSGPSVAEFPAFVRALLATLARGDPSRAAQGIHIDHTLLSAGNHRGASAISQVPLSGPSVTPEWGDFLYLVDAFNRPSISG